MSRDPRGNGDIHGFLELLVKIVKDEIVNVQAQNEQ
jgi:hypothetical protein